MLERNIKISEKGKQKFKIILPRRQKLISDLSFKNSWRLPMFTISKYIIEPKIVAHLRSSPKNIRSYMEEISFQQN
jgi:hypothetical protein